MAITTVGPWVLLLVGVVTVLGAVWLTVTKPDVRRPWWMWVFGVLLCGTGVYGPAFLTDYASFLKTLKTLSDEPSEANYQAFLQDMADGDVPESVQDAGTALMLQHPIPQLERLVESAEVQASSPAVKAKLQSMQESLAAQKEQAQVLKSGLVGEAIEPITIFQLPAATRFHLADELEHEPEDVRARLHLRTEDLQRLRELPR